MKIVKAIQIQEKGGPEVMRLEDIELPPPAAGEVLVRHEAIGVNFIDVYHRNGVYPLSSLPHGIGMEAAGRVEAVGPGVSGFGVGDRVAYLALAPGSYGDARNVPAQRVLALPEEVTAEVVAASLLKGMTVECLTHRVVAVKPGMTVLFHAAAGGVGLLACQWLRHLGVRVIGTASTEEKAALAKVHGADEVILYDGREDVVARVRELTHGAGVDVAYDGVGRATFESSLNALARRGTLVSFGNASGLPAPFDPIRLLLQGSVSVTGAGVFDYTASREELELSAKRLFEVLSKRVVQPHIGQRFALTEARACHARLESRASVGSSVLLPSPA